MTTQKRGLRTRNAEKPRQPKNVVVPTRERSEQGGICCFARRGKLPPRSRRRRQNILDIDNFRRILPRVAGRAIRELLILPARSLQSLNGEVSQGISPDVIANLVDRLVRGNQLLLRRRVHAV